MAAEKRDYQTYIGTIGFLKKGDIKKNMTLREMNIMLSCGEIDYYEALN